MQQLTGLDATFLYFETATTFLHIGAVSIYERPDDPDFSPYDAARRQIASRIPHIEPLRRRLVEVPLGLDHPYWVADPDFDLDFHIRHLALPENDHDLFTEQVARIFSRHLDRSRPLWEAYVIEGLGPDRWAMLTKFHHAAIDGGAGTRMMMMLHDADPDARAEMPEVLVPDAEDVPGELDMLRRATSGMVRYPVKAVRSQLRLIQEFAEINSVNGVAQLASTARSALRSLVSGPSDDGGVDLPVRSAPPTPWNVAISSQRRVAWGTVPMEDIKALKNALDGTVNDVVMAICTGALRRYLTEHDALPDEPLVAMVPVSIRTGDESDPWTNLISMILPTIPTDEPDVHARLDRVKQAMGRAKEQFDLTPADALIDITQNLSPAVAATASRLATRLNIANRARLPTNLVISNVPGPRVPLYLGGAKLLHYVPVSAVAESMGLNITVHSYLDSFDFGLVACREAVPDLHHLLDCHWAEIDHLFEVAGIDRPSRAAKTKAPAKKKAAAKKKAPAKKAPAKKAPAKKAPAKKAPAKKAPAKKAPAKKAPAKKAPAKKAPAATRR